MKLSVHSENKLMLTFAAWDVCNDYAAPMYNYLVHGYSPGSCFTAILANDFAGAILRSHPANTIAALKSLSGWIRDKMPHEANGSYETVNAWLNLTDDARRAILENRQLVFTEQQEVWAVLQNAPIVDTELY